MLTCFRLFADEEIQGTSTLISTNLLPPPSPIQAHRDSILKQQGSIKSDKRVSIKHIPTNSSSSNNSVKATSNVEYISEKYTDTGNSISGNRKRIGKPPTGARPASLVITKSEGHSQFKLVRSSSVDYDDMESQAPQHSTVQKSNINRTTLLEQLQEDESAPLVFTVHK
ncbi:hypothetical protein GQX74_005297 [Glossina fuscipes]|nr:hypothetical protein GQX74_005297 [Glossina fuscipes]